MKNKIALITGGTSGVGLSLVKELSKNNYDVYFIGTNEQKGLEIETELNALNLSNNTFINLDLSNINDIKKFVLTFKNKVSHLDLLANIAGVFLPKRIETKEGVEKTFAIGYLSSFILCTELTGLLEKSKNGKIINVAGVASQVLKPILDFKNLDFKTNYSPIKSAFSTVHAKTVLTEILAEKFKEKNITVNSFHPGVIKGNLTKNMPFILRLIFKIANPFISNVSKNGIYVCLSEDLKDITGKLFVNKKAININFSEDYKNTLWEKTIDILAT